MGLFKQAILAQNRLLAGGDSWQTGNFTLQAGDIAFVAGNAFLEFSDTVQVTLVIAPFDALLFGLAMVVFFLLLGQLEFGLFELGLENGPGIAVAGALRLAACTWRSLRRRSHADRRRPVRRHALNHRDLAAFNLLAATCLRVFGVVDVFGRCAARAAATVYALLRQGTGDTASQNEQGN